MTGWEYATIELVGCSIANPVPDYYLEVLVDNERKRKEMVEGLKKGKISWQELEKALLYKFPGGEGFSALVDEQWWVLRLDRDVEVVLNYEAGGTYSIQSGCLLKSDTSHRLVQDAANEGWEMTGGLPVGYREHFDTGALLGGYDTVPMMRRRRVG